jgi:hypothetical protein
MKVTAEQILNWHGSDHDIEELAQTMADILNGEYATETAKEEILSYNEEEEEPEFVRVKITAEVTTDVRLEKGETIEEFKQRAVDIYLHGAGKEGHLDKEDLGGNYKIEILNS